MNIIILWNTLKSYFLILKEFQLKWMLQCLCFSDAFSTNFDPNDRWINLGYNSLSHVGMWFCIPVGDQETRFWANWFPTYRVIFRNKTKTDQLGKIPFWEIPNLSCPLLRLNSKSESICHTCMQPRSKQYVVCISLVEWPLRNPAIVTDTIVLVVIRLTQIKYIQ